MSIEILIVDDNSDIRNILNDLIIDAGYQTRLAANFNQALKEIDKNNIKLFNIEDSDHFFRDLYLDEIIDYLIEFIE